MAQQQKALMECARWLSYCLQLGWPQKDLDRLDKLWWKHHDDNGRLLIGSGSAPRPTSDLRNPEKSQERDRT